MHCESQATRQDASRDTTVVLQLWGGRSTAYGQAERECRRLTLKVSNGIKKVSQRVTHTAPCTGGSSNRQLALLKFSFRLAGRQHPEGALGSQLKGRKEDEHAGCSRRRRRRNLIKNSKKAQKDAAQSDAKL